MASTFQRTKPLRAAVYTRVSQDRLRGTKREGVSADSQEREAGPVARAEGWELLDESYCDNDVSASPYAKKVRKNWSRLIADIEADAFEVLITWESSRGSRKLSEWAGFLELVRDHGILIHVISHGQTYDVRRKRDWKILAEDGVDAEYASHETSDRVKRLKADARTEGRPDGSYAFGWMRNYDPKTRELLNQAPDHDEWPTVVEIIDRLAAAEPQGAIAVDLNRRAMLPDDDPDYKPLRRGFLWRPDSIRRTAINPTHIGKIPEANFTGDPDDLFDAEWGPLVSARYNTGTADEEKQFVEKWRKVQRVLTDPGRSSWKPGRVKWELSGILGCFMCRGVHTLNKNERGMKSYRCHGMLSTGVPTGSSGCTSVKKEWAETAVRALLVERLILADLFEPAVAQDSADTAAARARVDQLKKRLETARDKAVEEVISWDDYAHAKATLQPQIERALADAETKDVEVLPVFQPFTDLTRKVGRREARRLVADMIEGMLVQQRRELIRGVFDGLYLKKGLRNNRTFDPSRLVYRWRGCADHEGADWRETCSLDCLGSEAGE
jgi:DNA invertase Pin-like site-specific DNA recombinase